MQSGTMSGTGTTPEHQTHKEHLVPETYTCQVCGVRSETRCGRCKLTYYCGREDWQKHRPDCRILSARGPPPPVGSAQRLRETRLVVTLGSDKLVKAARDDILPCRDVCKVFGIPSEQPILERAVFACYQSAVCTFGVTTEQIVDAHMHKRMDELILSIPDIRGDPYGLMVVENGGIKVERFPGVP